MATVSTIRLRWFRTVLAVALVYGSLVNLGFCQEAGDGGMYEDDLTGIVYDDEGPLIDEEGELIPQLIEDPHMFDEASEYHYLYGDDVEDLYPEAGADLVVGENGELVENQEDHYDWVLGDEEEGDMFIDPNYEGGDEGFDLTGEEYYVIDPEEEEDEDHPAFVPHPDFNVDGLDHEELVAMENAEADEGEYGDDGGVDMLWGHLEGQEMVDNNGNPVIFQGGRFDELDFTEDDMEEEEEEPLGPIPHWSETAEYHNELLEEFEEKFKELDHDGNHYLEGWQVKNILASREDAEWVSDFITFSGLSNKVDFSLQEFLQWVKEYEVYRMEIEDQYWLEKEGFGAHGDEL